MIEFDLLIVDGRRTYTNPMAAAAQISTSLKTAPNRTAQQISREMLRALQLVALELQSRHSRPWDGSVKHDNPDLFIRSGGGLQSIRDSVRTGGQANFDSVSGQISTGKMTIHETGGTITAKRAKYLTIPLPAAMDSRGVPLKPKARDWPNTFVQRSRAGNLIIFQRRGREIVPLYLLKPSVYIKPRLGMEESIESTLPWFQERALDALAEKFKA